MLQTDAYIFLNVDDPICAWCAYRGALVSARLNGENGFLSVWLAGLMRSNNPQRISREFQLEQVRRNHFPQFPSRLSSIYCFLKIEDAKKAASLWGGPFCDSNLIEVSLGNVIPSHRFDSNWISYYSHIVGSQNSTPSWMHQYWRGDPCPYDCHDPIWETLIEGRAVVLGTEVRKRAYEIIKSCFPESLGVLEIARIAA